MLVILQSHCIVLYVQFIQIKSRDNKQRRERERKRDQSQIEKVERRLE